MNFKVLPKERTDVVFKVLGVGEIYSGFFLGGKFLTIAKEHLTASYRPENVEYWFDSEELINAAQPKQPEPETIIIPTRDYSAFMWEQRRYEIAKDILGGSISNEGMHGSDMLPAIKSECFRAIQYADALVELLQKGE